MAGYFPLCLVLLGLYVHGTESQAVAAAQMALPPQPPPQVDANSLQGPMFEPPPTPPIIHHSVPIIISPRPQPIPTLIQRPPYYVFPKVGPFAGQGAPIQPQMVPARRIIGLRRSAVGPYPYVLPTPSNVYVPPEALGYAYVPYGSAQSLSINPQGGIQASQAAQAEELRRQNLNVQSHVIQIGNNNQNAQSDIGQSQRRQNLNAQSQVSQIGGR